MCLYIEQKEGSRRELATQALEAVKAGNLDQAEAIYTEVTGREFGTHNKEPMHPWLLYCMPGEILSYVADEHWPKRQPRHNDDERYYEQLRKNAERAYGGVWELHYTYQPSHRAKDKTND